MLKHTQVVLFLMLLMSFVSVQAGGVIAPKPSAPNVAAKSHILIDYDSGRVLASDNPDQRLPPASITKLMTSYVVSHELHSGNIALDDEVLISEKAWRMIGSRSFLKSGHQSLGGSLASRHDCAVW